MDKSMWVLKKYGGPHKDICFFFWHIKMRGLIVEVHSDLRFRWMDEM